MSNTPNDPFYLFGRGGTSSSPFKVYNEPLSVFEGRVLLTEVPRQKNHVVVKDGSTVYGEVYDSGALTTDNVYFVDYDSGTVYFDNSHNGKQLTFTYTGEGYFNIPARRVYTQIDSSDIPSQNLQDMIDNYNQLNGTDLYNLFDPQTGHKHTGASGDAPPIDSLYVSYDDGNGTITTVKNTLDDHAKEIMTNGINIKSPIGTILSPCKGDGVTDDTSNLIAILQYASENCVNVIIPNGNYLLTSGITWDGANYSIIGKGNATLDFTSMTSGYAINVVGQGYKPSTDAYNNTLHEFTGIHVLGLQSDSNTVDGFYFNDSANDSMLSLRDVDIYGFRDQFVYDANEWILKFYSVSGQHASRYIHHWLTPNNNGENYSYYGCAFYNANNSTVTGTALYSDYSGGHMTLDANFFGCSFDYSDRILYAYNGAWSFHGCHFEDNSKNPMFELFVGGNTPNISIYGGFINPTENNGTRPSIIQTTGSGIGIVLRPSQIYMQYKTYPIIKPTDSNISDLDFHVGFYGMGGQANDISSYPSDSLNLIRNGDFESGDFTGWNTGGNGSGVFNVGTSVTHTGTYSCSIINTTAGSGSVYQTIPVKPGQKILFNCWYHITSFTQGYASLRVVGRDSQGANFSYSNLNQISATQSNYTAFSYIYTVPAGVLTLEVDIYCNNFIGSAYFDKVTAYFI